MKRPLTFIHTLRLFLLMMIIITINYAADFPPKLSDNTNINKVGKD